MVWFPEVRRVAGEGDVGDVFVVGHRLVDEFLRFAVSAFTESTSWAGVVFK